MHKNEPKNVIFQTEQMNFVKTNIVLRENTCSVLYAIMQQNMDTRVRTQKQDIYLPIKSKHNSLTSLV